MRLPGPRGLLALLVACALLLAPAGALGDGDPASDVLLLGDTFLPYQPKVSPSVAAALNTTVARARAAGFPVKVAVVAAATDLGAVPDLFGQPQKYADFLEKEISYNTKATLLVVMPQGLGVVPAPAPPGASVVPGTGADGLGRAAITAVGVLAARAGHPIALSTIGSSSGSSGGGTPALLTFGAPLALVLLVAGVAALLRGRRIPAGDPELEDDDDLDDQPSTTGHRRQPDAPAPSDQ